MSSTPGPSTVPFFFFNDTATTEIYTLSLHDALPISELRILELLVRADTRTVTRDELMTQALGRRLLPDRKSTRLNSSHSQISYAVFCLKKKKKRQIVSDGAIIYLDAFSATAARRQ